MHLQRLHELRVCARAVLRSEFNCKTWPSSAETRAGAAGCIRGEMQLAFALSACDLSIASMSEHSGLLLPHEALGAGAAATAAFGDDAPEAARAAATRMRRW